MIVLLKRSVRALTAWAFVTYVEGLVRRRIARSGLEHSNCLREALRKTMESGGAAVLVNSKRLPGRVCHAFYVPPGLVPELVGVSYEPCPDSAAPMPKFAESMAFVGAWREIRVNADGKQINGEWIGPRSGT